MAFRELVRVVIRELFAALNVPDRFDPDALVLDDCVAVGVAGMVDPARIVPADGRVDHDIVVDGEEERVVPDGGVVLGIAGIAFRRCQAFARVLDQPRARADATRGERAEPLDRRFADFERECG